MELTDEEFREEYKPLHIPAHYLEADTQENKIVYALAQLGEGTADDVIRKLDELEPNIISDQLTLLAEQVLSGLYQKGLLKGREQSGKMHYSIGR